LYHPQLLHSKAATYCRSDGFCIALISPAEALMKAEVTQLQKKDLSAAFIGQIGTTFMSVDLLILRFLL
jgi:hypothetical protein